MSLSEEAQVTDKYTLQDYLHGRCHIFGFALLTFYQNHQVQAIAKYIWNQPDDGKLIHCYIEKNNDCDQKFDARGLISDEELEAYELDYNGDDIAYYDIDISDFLDDFNKELLPKPEDQEVQQIMQFLMSNKDHFIK
jgi:hypothetical protein